MNDYDNSQQQHHHHQQNLLLNQNQQQQQLLQDPLLAQQDPMNFVNPDQERENEIRLRKKVDSLNGEIVFRLLLVTLGATFVIFSHNSPCIFPASTFLAGCIGIYLFDSLLIMFEVHYIKAVRKESVKMMVLRYLLMVFQTSWLIWGNILYYNKDNQAAKACAESYKLGIFLYLLIGYVEMFKCFCLSLIVCIMVPYIFYAVRRARRPNWIGAPPTLIKNLYKSRFDPTFNNAQAECPICMVEFTDTDEITPLPCDEKHYFHEPCIRQWLEKNNNCPLCKKAITKEAIEEQKKRHRNERNNRRN